MSPPLSKRPAGPYARTSKPSSSKRLSGHGLPKAKNVQIQDDDPEETMATSFIPFCTYCERQIVTPSNSILYCSESCRRRDQSKTLPYPSTTMNQSPPLTPLQPFSSEDLPVRDIIPQRSPTAITNNRYSYSDLSEDSLQFSEDDRRRPVRNVQDSEAALYLRSFHTVEAQVEMMSRTPRPRYNRSSTSIAGLSTAPSLSDSPSSADALSMPYTPSNRPLPTRYNPFSSSSCSTRTADLVNPFAIVQPVMPTTAPSSLSHPYSFKSRAVTSQSADLAEGDVAYDRRGPISSSSPSHASLKQMFRFSEMQAPPSSNGV